MSECCKDCKYYRIENVYFNLLDELTEPLDNCGLYNSEE